MCAACTRIWCVRPVSSVTRTSVAPGRRSSDRETRQGRLAGRVDPDMALPAPPLGRQQRCIHRALGRLQRCRPAGPGRSCRPCPPGTGPAGVAGCDCFLASSRHPLVSRSSRCTRPRDVRVGPRRPQQLDGAEADAAAAVHGETGRLVEHQQVGILVEHPLLDPACACGRTPGAPGPAAVRTGGIRTSSPASRR